MKLMSLHQTRLLSFIVMEAHHALHFDVEQQSCQFIFSLLAMQPDIHLGVICSLLSWQHGMELWSCKNICLLHLLIALTAA